MLLNWLRPDGDYPKSLVEALSRGIDLAHFD